MSISKFNAEGCLDMTAYEALVNVTKEEKRLVYICSPYAGNIEYNVSRARGYSRFVMSKGHIPLAPHLLFPQFLDDDDRQEREMGLSFALHLLKKSDGLWVFGSKVTDGMAREIKRAKSLRIPIRYFNERCEEVER